MHRRSLLAGLALLCCAGCTLGPDFDRPAAPAAAGYGPTPPPDPAAGTAGEAAQRFVPGAPVPAGWWRAFGSPELDALVAEALRHNAGLEAARATLRQAEALVAAGRGGFYPSLGLAAQAARQRAEQAPAASSPYSLRTARLEVSYAPDLFGGTRREVEGLVAEAHRQGFELAAAALGVSGNLINAVIEEAALQAQLAATREIIAVAEDSLRLSRSRLALGAVPRGEVLLQEAEVMQRRAELPALQKAVEARRTLITVLLGRIPDRPLPPLPTLDALRLPETLPVSLPSALVRQRPDILAAEAALRAANAGIGVASANMLPRLPLTAAYGTAQAPGVDAFTPQGLIWSVAAGLTQPLFQGGRLAGQRAAAIAARDAAAARYRATVLAAFRDVADALRAIGSDAEELRARREAARVAALSLEIARRQQRLGAASLLEVLAAQQADARARIALVQATAARYSDTVALHLALGGGILTGHAPSSLPP